MGLEQCFATSRGCRYTPETYSQLATAIQKNQLGVSDRAGLVGKPGIVLDGHGFFWENCTVMAMASSYNWLFLWDNKHSINGVTC